MDEQKIIAYTRGVRTNTLLLLPYKRQRRRRTPMSAIATCVLFDIYNIRAVINPHIKTVNNTAVYETVLENTITGQSFILPLPNTPLYRRNAEDALAFGRAAIEHSRDAEMDLLSLRADLVEASNDLIQSNEDTEQWNVEAENNLRAILEKIATCNNLLLQDSEYRSR